LSATFLRCAKWVKALSLVQSGRGRIVTCDLRQLPLSIRWSLPAAESRPATFTPVFGE
jgi:hypothetical protein